MPKLSPRRGNSAVDALNEMTDEDNAAMTQAAADDKAERSVARHVPEPEPTPEPDEVAEVIDDAPEPTEIEAVAPAEAAAAKKAEKDKTIPLATLLEERTRRKQAEEQQSKTQQDFAKLSGRMEVIQALIAQQAEESKRAAPAAQVEIPSIDTDPVGHFKAKDAIREREFQELRQWRQQQEANAHVQNNVQAISRVVSAQEIEFTKANPQYKPASQFLVESRDAELQQMGYDPAARAQIISNDILTMGANALSNNRNAASMFYEIAKARGFRETPASNGEASPTPAQKIQAQIEAAKTAAPIPSAAQKLATVAKGQEAGQSLGQAQGGNAAGPPSAEALLAMSDEDFAEMTKGKNWKKLLENSPRR